MGDFLAAGLAWLEGQRHEHMTRTVTYGRGASSCELAASVGRTSFEEADEYGRIHRWEARDFIVRAADLLLDGSPILPDAGDRVLETDGAVVRTYEVLAPAGETPWRYCDPDRTSIRIHTKRVAVS